MGYAELLIYELAELVENSTVVVGSKCVTLFTACPCRGSRCVFVCRHPVGVCGDHLASRIDFLKTISGFLFLPMSGEAPIVNLLARLLRL